MHEYAYKRANYLVVTLYTTYLMGVASTGISGMPPPDDEPDCLKDPELRLPLGVDDRKALGLRGGTGGPPFTYKTP